MLETWESFPTFPHFPYLLSFKPSTFLGTIISFHHSQYSYPDQTLILAYCSSFLSISFVQWLEN